MTALAQLHFLRPLWLLALPVLPLLAWAWHARRRRASAWRAHVDAHLLPHLLEVGGGRTRLAGVAALGAGLLAVLALAGPTWRMGEQPLWRTRTPLVVALDLSSAMLAADLPPSRLLQARAKLATLLRERAGGQVALVVFAGDAYTVAPLTEDAANIALFLDALAPDVMPQDGHRPDRGLSWAQSLLRQAGFDSGDILLVTDHADGDARIEAAAAARAGFHVSVLGLGTPAGAPYRGADGGIRQARLDGASLAALARAGDGDYVAVTPDDTDLRALGVLDARNAGNASADAHAGRSWRDEGYWLLPPLMLLALLAFRRGQAPWMLVLCIGLLPWPAAHAQQGTPWRRADQVAHARLLAGQQAYHAGDYAGAARAYAGIDTADAHYNLANALAKQGDYPQALREYDRALRAQPRMADAIANRRAVEAAMKRRPPSSGQGQQQQRQQGGQSKQPSQGGAGQPTPSSAQGASRTTPPTRQPPAQAQPRDAGASPPRNGDADAQRAADAAQRERMQRALQQPSAQQAQASRAAPGHRTETAAERERRLANEAWLRRVPDDPGGLLRAKFRLEYERRQQGGSE